MSRNALAHDPTQAPHGHCFTADRRWSARMELDFAVRQGRTTLAKMQFHGPLRVQRPYYPGRPHRRTRQATGPAALPLLPAAPAGRACERRRPEP